jgi:hypothetical protein
VRGCTRPSWIPRTDFENACQAAHAERCQGVTGLRPGEKLSEKLYYDAETVRGTEVPKIARVLDPQPPPDVRSVVENLLSMADGDREVELREALFAAISIREDGPRVEAEGRAANIVSFPAMNGRNGTRPASSPGRATAEADDLDPYEAEELAFDPDEFADGGAHAVTRR